MLEALGIEALSDGEAAEICGELDEISVRFLAIQVTIDKRVSVKTTFKELSKIQNTLQRAARNLDDPDIKSGITAVRAEATDISNDGMWPQSCRRKAYLKK